MEQWRGVGEALERYLRLGTFPVGVRFLTPGEAPPRGPPAPGGPGDPHRGLPGFYPGPAHGLDHRPWARTIPAAPCSTWPWAGWRFDPAFMHAFFTTMQYAKRQRRPHRRALTAWACWTRECATLVLSPLTRTRVVPHLVMVFASPAQVMRLVQATSAGRGAGAWPGSFGGLGGSCNDGAHPPGGATAWVVLPGNGDRSSRPQGPRDGLRLSRRLVRSHHRRPGGHRGPGIRYPMPANLPTRAASSCGMLAASQRFRPGLAGTEAAGPPLAQQRQFRLYPPGNTILVSGNPFLP